MMLPNGSRGAVVLLMVGVLTACGPAASRPGATGSPEGTRAAQAASADASACERGDGAACLRQGRSLTDLGPAPQSEQAIKAVALFDAACRRKVWDGCAELAALTFIGAGGLGRSVEGAVTRAREACTAGSVLACGYLGYMLVASGAADASAHVADHAASVDARLEQACTDGDGQVCRALGLSVAGGGFPVTAPDLERAERLLLRACELGVVDGCVNAGRLLASKANPDHARAEALFRRTCNAGHGVGCAMLGTMHYQGVGMAVDEAAAMALFERACELQSTEGCTAVAGLYNSGSGGRPRDPGKARRYYQRGCDLGMPVACGDCAIVIVSDPAAKPADLSRAADMLRMACGAGLVDRCSDLGVLYARGMGVPQDLERARVLFKQACDGGNRQACDNLKLY
jgi:TPR repeat protein